MGSPAKGNPVVPETPRAAARHASAKPDVTPSFSFGLGFLPSFNLGGSPRHLGMAAVFSPQRFFNILNSLSKAVGATPATAGAHTAHRRRPLDPLDDNIFHTFTPPRPHTRFLESLSASKPGASQREDDCSMQSADDSMDLWSLGYDYSTLALIEEAEAEPKAAAEPAAAAQSPPVACGLQEDASDKENAVPTKKRRATNTPLSPSFALATQIDTIASPRDARRRSSASVRSVASAASSRSVASIASASSATASWTADLDEVLLIALYKFRAFQDRQPAETAIKRPPQNKILARMLQNRTGVVKTPQQVAARLSRLRKHSTPGSVVAVTDEVMRAPLDSLMSVATSANLHLGSSPMAKETPAAAFVLAPLQLCLSFSLHSNDPHYFSHFDSSVPGAQHCIMHSEMLTTELAGSVCTAMREDLERLAGVLARVLVPVWIVDHSISLSRDSMTPGSSTSPFTSTPMPSSSSKSVSLDNGEFHSFIKMAVHKQANTAEPAMLNWRCRSQIYKDNRLIFKTDEYINGYADGQRLYELQVPFLKTFWSGFLTFMNNGGEDSLATLMVSQVLYEGKEVEGTFEGEEVRGCLVHHFKAAEMYGVTKFNIARLKTSNFAAPIVEADDDNATVVADSSPYKPSPRNDTHNPKGVKIDVSKTLGVPAGPASAPIYNANVVHKLNQDALWQQDKSRGPQSASQAHFPHQEQLQRFHQPPPHHFQYQQHMFQPPMLTASHSTGNIHQPVRPSGPLPLTMPYATLAGAEKRMASWSGAPGMDLAPGPMAMGGFAPYMPTPQQYIPQMSQPQMNHQMNPQHQTHQHIAQQQFAPPPPTAPKKAAKNKDKPMEITFGPILEYDPDTLHNGSIKAPAASGPLAGAINRFPVTTLVSMYKPKK